MEGSSGAGSSVEGEMAIPTRARHRVQLHAALDALDAFLACSTQGAELELAVEELRIAVSATVLLQRHAMDLTLLHTRRQSSHSTLLAQKLREKAGSRANSTDRNHVPRWQAAPSCFQRLTNRAQLHFACRCSVWAA